MSTNARGDNEVERDVSERLSSSNGYGSRHGAERIATRALDEARDSPDVARLRPDQLDDDRVLPVQDEHDRDVQTGLDTREGEDAGDVDGWDQDDRVEEESDGHPPASRDDEGSEDWHGRLRAVDVHHVTFPRASLTRRGYDERSVDEFLSRVEAELVLLFEERADLRDRVARLERQARRAQDAGPQTEEAQAQAVRLLAKAQQLADQYVAEAEDYSKRVAQESRQQYDELVAEARAAAADLVAEAEERSAAMLQEAEEAAREAAVRAAEAVPAPAPAAVDPAVHEQTEAERRALEEQVAYLRTFGQVCRTQLRAYLEALLQDVEEEWGRSDPAAVGELQRSAADGASRPPSDSREPAAVPS